MSGVSAEKRHPIQVVARRTGLSADVLRVWEKRYGVPRPARSGSRRRLYSDEDIEHLRLLKRAVGAGRSIGQLAGLGANELTALVRQDAAAAAVPVPVPAAADGAGAVITDQALAAIRALDAGQLEAVFRRAMLDIEAVRFLDEVVTPLLVRIGELWHREQLRPVHEHLASTVIRSVLARYMTTFAAQPHAPLGLFATPARQRHEFGAMLAAAAASRCGWRVTYLGADLPADDLAATARQTEATLVGLSLMYPADDPALGDELRALRAALPADVVLLVGGAVVRGYQRVLHEIGALIVPDLARLRAALTSLAAETSAAV